MRRVIFVRQQFTPYGGGELILDRTISALRTRGVPTALLGRGWSGRKDLDFIACDPPRFPRAWREHRFARAACARLGQEEGALVQAHERIPCCDIFRAGDGVHAAFLERRALGLNAPARTALRLHPFHRSVLGLERELFASPRLKRVLANSSMVADEIVRTFSYPRERIRLVPNGIDLDRFHPDAREAHRTRVRRALGCDERRPVALLVGSGYKRKGLDVAIAAVAASGTGAELWAVGHERRPGAYAALAARSGLGSRLRLIGPVPDTLPYYAAADVFLLPSVYDPFPSSLIEALACGLPAVTSSSCGAREAAARLDPALVRDALDADGLAEALRRAFDLAARTDTAADARAIVREYTIEDMIERMLTVYDELGLPVRNLPA